MGALLKNPPPFILHVPFNVKEAPVKVTAAAVENKPLTVLFAPVFKVTPPLKTLTLKGPFVVGQ